MTAVRLMLRRYRLLISSWAILIVAFCTVGPPAYESTFPTSGQRRAAAELAQQDAASTLLYGKLPDPGTSAQFFTWEVGAILTLLVAFMAVLLAAALTRAAEEDGSWELLLTCGSGRRTPILSACLVLLIVAVLLATGCALALGVMGVTVGTVEGVTWPGAIVFGLVIGLTFLLIGALTAVIAQIVTTARTARVLSLAVVGVAFGVRVVADDRDLEWLNWLTPMALRATASPFTDNRWWALALYAAVAGALGWLAMWLCDRREYGTGLLRVKNASDARLNIRSGLSMNVRLSRGTIAAWTVGVTCIGAMFAAMGSGAVKQSEQGDLDSFLGEQLGTGDPAAAYFAYSGVIVGLAVTAFAVLSVLRAGQEEHAGLTEPVVATGVRRWRPLAWTVTITAAASALILLSTGTAAALIAPTTMAGDDIALRAFSYYVGQWPAAVAAAGWTALLIGLRPRLGWLAWLPVAASGTVALLGSLLGIPDSVRDLGIFQHVPDVAGADVDLFALAVLLVLAALTTLAGLAGATRRDLSLG